VIQKGKKLKIEIVNNSADSLIVNILLKLEDLQKVKWKKSQKNWLYIKTRIDFFDKKEL
jgi:hypothetical protein